MPAQEYKDWTKSSIFIKKEGQIMTDLSIDTILKHLPHRYPFLFIDKVVSIEKGKKIHAQKNVSINEPFFKDISQINQ